VASEPASRRNLHPLPRSTATGDEGPR